MPLAPLCQCNQPCIQRVKSYNSEERLYWVCAQGSCQFFVWDDAKGTTLSLAGPPCQCRHPSRQQISKTANNPNRPFWCCASTSRNRCHFFQWAADAAAPTTPPPPSPAQPTPSPSRSKHCSQCGKAVQIQKVGPHNTKGNAGKEYVKCAGCGKFDLLTTAPPLPVPTRDTPGHVEYLVPHELRTRLQAVFEVPPGHRLVFQARHDEDRREFDHLRVECAWKVHNPSRTARYTAFRGQLASQREAAGLAQRTALRADHQAAVDALGEPLDVAANEVLLMHGTCPENLFNILFEGLDPGLARQGLFGRGTYFAEESAKAAQFMTVDHDWKGHSDQAQHPLHPLHHKLYELGIKHTGDVYYGLVCRVALGDPLVTQDGAHCMGVGEGEGACVAEGAQMLFEDDPRTKLRGGKHSLVAEVALTRGFREFVIFNPCAVDVLYLVALKPEKHYCSCGVPAVRRTVTKETINHGRPYIFCEHINDELGCGMLPHCYCDRPAEVAESKTGTLYYRCGRKRNFCQFKDFNGPLRGGGGTPQSARKRTGEYATLGSPGSHASPSSAKRLHYR